MRERGHDQTILATRHLGADAFGGALFGREPRELERPLRWSAIAFAGNNECERDRVLTRIVKAGDGWIGEVLNHGEWLR